MRECPPRTFVVPCAATSVATVPSRGRLSAAHAGILFTAMFERANQPFIIRGPCAI